jgi:uncharacterized protein (TIGR02266 family)
MSRTRPFHVLSSDPHWTRPTPAPVHATPGPTPMPAPAIDTGPLARDEALLAHKERELEAREATVAHDEVNTLADQAGVEGRVRALERRLRALIESGVPGAAALAGTLPRPAPPPSVAERKRALNMRRAALDARDTAARRREEACDMLRAHLDSARAALADAERRLGLLERWPDVEPEATPASDLDPPHDERRVGRRSRLDCRVGFETHDNFFTGFARDLSDGGLFVATFDTLPVGSALDVGFDLPDGTHIEARARVRWVRDLVEGTADAWPGIGLCFEDLPPEAAAAIERFMSAREPIFFAE